MALSTYASMQADIALTGMAQLLNTDIGALLNRCQTEEVDAYDWSFVFTNTVIYSAAPYGVGTVTVTQGSQTVKGTGTNWTAGFGGFQMRIGASGILLPVASVQNSTTLTLTVPYLAPSQTNSPYFLSQSYYPIPNAKEVQAVRQIFFLNKSSREVLNLGDPQRLSIGGNPCTTWAPAPYLNGVLQMELWPVSSAAVPYVVEYRSTAIPMVNPTDIPQVPQAVLEAKTMVYLCQSLIASSGDARWNKLLDTWTTRYDQELEKAIHADHLRELTQDPRDPTPTFGMDYLPSHDPTRW